MSRLRACLSIFRIKTAESFQYRFAGLAGASTSVIWAFIEIIVYTVFYTYANPTSAKLTLTQVVSYSWLAQVIFIIQPMNIDGEILGKIVNGDLGIELIRPLNIYLNWFSKIAASRITPLFWRGSIVLLAGLLMPKGYRLEAPQSVDALIAMLVSLISALLLCTAYASLICTLRISITWGEGPTYIMLLIGGVLSGAYLPLELWPNALQGFLYYQPFSGYLDIPLRLYLGTIPPEGAFGAISLQLMWSAIFILFGKLIMDKQLKRIIIQGG